jgi:hypothetical protein
MQDDFSTYKYLVKDTLDFDKLIEKLLRLKPYKNSKLEIAKIEQPKSFPAVICLEFFEDAKKDDWIFYRWVELENFSSCMPAPKETAFQWVKSKLETWIAARVEKFGTIMPSQLNLWGGLILKELKENGISDETILGNMPDEIDFKV